MSKYGMPDINNALLPFQEPYRLFQSIWVLLGIWMLRQLINMVYYEYYFYPNSGWDYIRYGRMYVIRLNILVKKIKEIKND